MSLESRLGRSPLLLTRVSAFVAVGVVLGLVLVSIPNVELITAVCYLSGFLLGVRAGILTGALTETLFAGFHPMGSSIGFVLIAQIIGMAFAGLLGGLSALLIGKIRTGVRYFGIIVFSGVVATVFFDCLTNLAFPLMAGFSFSQTLIILIAGIPFAALHLATNVLVFGFIVRSIIPRLEKAWLTS